jgi:hydroxypyruvate isomerase
MTTIRFAANLSMLYPDRPFLDRFEAAAADGFEGVEYLFPYAYPAAEITARLRAHGLQQVLFNTPPGGLEASRCEEAWLAGWRGTACVPGREAEFRAGIEAALRYADALDCPRVHAMVGLRPEGCSPAEADTVLLSNLRWASSQAAKAGRTLLIEPINPINMPGFHLSRQDHAHALVQAVDSPHVKVQLDLFHCQRVEGQLAEQLRQALPTGRVGHLQIADTPDRHEPSTGEIDWPPLFALIERLMAEKKWTGWVGCEYLPADASAGGTSRGLAWLRSLRQARA